uniref:Uncharacterized protein n=1 Tax=Pisolithus microcarpus TaxID=178872 RepID=A0A873QKU2_9AGAM|nr:hypothetical protein J6642_mgp19 [Pisolithus microcarpus]QPA36148.1 hypothetical protein [Pisolithus microcarpus]
MFKINNDLETIKNIRCLKDFIIKKWNKKQNKNMITAAKLYTIFCQSDFTSYVEFLDSYKNSFSELEFTKIINEFLALYNNNNQTVTELPSLKLKIKQIVPKFPILNLENIVPVPEYSEYQLRKRTMCHIRDVALENKATSYDQYLLVKAINDL